MIRLGKYVPPAGHDVDSLHQPNEEHIHTWWWTCVLQVCQAKRFMFRDNYNIYVTPSYKQSSWQDLYL